MVINAWKNLLSYLKDKKLVKINSNLIQKRWRGSEYSWKTAWKTTQLVVVSIFFYYYTPAPPEGRYTVLPLSVLPSVPRYFSSHFSQQLFMPYCGKCFWTRQIPTSCLPTYFCSWFLYTLNIYAGVS